MEDKYLAKYQNLDSSFTEKFLFKNGKYVRLQMENRSGIIFMRAKQRVLFTAE